VIKQSPGRRWVGGVRGLSYKVEVRGAKGQNKGTKGSVAKGGVRKGSSVGEVSWGGSGVRGVRKRVVDHGSGGGVVVGGREGERVL